MRTLRFAFLIPAVIISLILTCYHWGIISSDCAAGCANIMNWPFSRWAALIALGGYCTLIYLAYYELEKQFIIVSLAAVGFSIFLFSEGVALHGWCLWCMALSWLVLSNALTCIKYRKIAFVVSLLPLLLFANAIQGMYQESHPRPLLASKIRTYEPPLDPIFHDMVLFSDTDDMACRTLARRIDANSKNRRKDIRIHYRWYLSQNSSPADLHAVIAIESLSAIKYDKGQLLRQKIYNLNTPLTDEAILNAANSINELERVKQLINNPPTLTLLVMKQDEELAKSLNVNKVPEAFSEDAGVLCAFEAEALP